MKTNVKFLLLCILSAAAISLISPDVNALSLQGYGGGGTLYNSEDDNDKSSGYYSFGLNVFIYEGRYLDFFSGVEYANASPYSQSLDADYDAEMTAGVLGVNIKPAIKGRWKPYISLGGIGGSINYSVGHRTDDYKELISASEGSSSFITYRGGLGLDINTSKRTSINIEANYTGERPGFKSVIGNRSTGEIKEVILSEDAQMIGFKLGFRYYF